MVGDTCGCRFEPRYKEISMNGARRHDELRDGSSWHAKFNWRANVRRDLVVNGGVPSTSIISWHRIFTECMAEEGD